MREKFTSNVRRDVSRMRMRHKYAQGWKHIKKVKQQRTRYYCHCYRFSIACYFFRRWFLTRWMAEKGSQPQPDWEFNRSKFSFKEGNFCREKRRKKSEQIYSIKFSAVEPSPPTSVEIASRDMQALSLQGYSSRGKIRRLSTTSTEIFGNVFT